MASLGRGMPRAGHQSRGAPTDRRDAARGNNISGNTAISRTCHRGFRYVVAPPARRHWGCVSLRIWGVVAREPRWHRVGGSNPGRTRHPWLPPRLCHRGQLSGGHRRAVDREGWTALFALKNAGGHHATRNQMDNSAPTRVARASAERGAPNRRASARWRGCGSA